MNAVTVCSARPGLLTDSPRWDAARAELLWVDVLAGRLHRAGLDEHGRPWAMQTLHAGRQVCAAAPAVGGGYVLVAGAGFWHLEVTGAIRELAKPATGRPGVRMTTGICDPQGRFWAGAAAQDAAPGAGCLYRLDLDGTCTPVVGNLTVPGGIGWSPDGRTMYLADGGTTDLYAFDFDPANGGVSGRRTLAHIAVPHAVPDGLTVDDHGELWVALRESGVVAHFGEDGSPRATVPLPVDRPTSCAFGGSDGSALFVTTARDGLDDIALARQPEAGHLLRIGGLGVTGPPCAYYRGTIQPSAQQP